MLSALTGTGHSLLITRVMLNESNSLSKVRLSLKPFQAFHLDFHFNCTEWKKIVKQKAQLWAKLVESWIGNLKDYLIVKYEDVKVDPKRE